tara:strand:- start:505 stop:900 length:396 start_codon:yes stop_codon:yes gene_type:complete
VALSEAELEREELGQVQELDAILELAAGRARGQGQAIAAPSDAPGEGAFAEEVDQVEGLGRQEPQAGFARGVEDRGREEAAGLEVLAVSAEEPRRDRLAREGGEGRSSLRLVGDEGLGVIPQGAGAALEGR